jgi:DNA-directed RNA polymerase II subunit RPB1
MYYNEDVKKISKIEFSIYRNKDIKLYSAVSDDPYGIDLAESYENYEPKKGGLVDLRLGSCDIYLSCTTCGEKSLDCPGHFGHTVLSEPVFNYGYLTHLRNILQCICLSCSKLLINKNDINFKKILNKKKEAKFKEIKNLTKNITQCFYCGVSVHKIKREDKDNGSIKIIIEKTIGSDNNETKKIREIKTPRECIAILRNISEDDCYLLGFNPKIQRPEDMIIENFPIPPVIIRPTSKVDFLSAATMEDALTLKISDIINSNKRIRQQKEKELIGAELSNYHQDLINLLQYHVAIYFNNESINLPRTEFKTGGKPIKSISERIQGKYGRVRCNIMGKRVDFSARTVITSDPYVDIDQLGVPKRIAIELTIPEEVTPYNIKYLSELVNNGRDKYPGANFVLKTSYKEGKMYIQKIDLKYRKKTTKLNYGDIVERHMIDDDYVLFNRQPTLHKPSMMGHRVQILDNNNLDTFRMNVSVCKPYNADFDGDEMNIHLPQSIQARNEVKRIANVKYQIVGVKSSSPIIGCQQDTLSGAFMLTNPNTKLIGWEIANILCNTTSENKYEIEMNKYYTGHEIFTYIIPTGINIQNEKKLEIINGILISGYLDTTALSFAKNSIIHFIWDKFDPEKTRKFIDDSQRLILNYLLYNGQTCGFNDTYCDKKILDQINQIVTNEILKSKYDITQYENDTLILDVNMIEKKLTEPLNTIQANIGDILMKSLDQNNFFWIAAKSGARGSLTNIAQIIGVIGQQMLEGSRFKKKIEGRTLFYFHKDDDTPEARGFIKNSYLKGLNSYEFFFHLIAAREGLIDTAIKTAQTGYITRQLIRSLEDLNIKYDGTNRNDKNIIVQLVYGENGINQSIQTEIVLNIVNMNNIKLKELCFNENQITTLVKNNKKSELKKLNEELYIKLLKYRDDLRIIQRNSLINYKILEKKFMLPVNLFRITQDYMNININNNIIDLTPFEIIEAIEEFLNNYDNRIIIALKPEDKYLKLDDRSIKYLLEISLYEYLAPVKCIFKYKLSKKSFYEMMKEIKLNYIKALVEPGEMVGVIAGQSIGEPTTQLTLNTKHFAGVAGKGSANMGLPRIQELLHYSKNIKIPQMIIYFQSEFSNNKNNINKIVSYFKYLSLRELISSIEIYYDMGLNNHNDIILKEDNVSNPFFVNNQKTKLNLLPLVLRFKMNTEKMITKETSLLDIKTKFISHWYNYYNNIKNLKKTEKDIISKINRCAILSNSSIDNEQIIHIRFNMISFNYNIITEFLRMIIDDIRLKGINNINNFDDSLELNTIFDATTGDVIENKEYVIYTNGINIEKLRTIKGIDHTRTKCNDIYTTLRLYGIEAARQILLHEIAFAFDSSKINYTHLFVLVDQMTHLGEIISIDRHGLSKIDLEPFTRASFEKTMNHFVNAAIYNEKDSMKSNSACISVGKVINGGTGMFNLLLDTKKLEKSEYTEDETGGRITFIPLNKEPLIDDLIKNPSGKISFFIPNNL